MSAISDWQQKYPNYPWHPWSVHFPIPGISWQIPRSLEAKSEGSTRLELQAMKCLKVSAVETDCEDAVLSSDMFPKKD